MTRKTAFFIYLICTLVVNDIFGQTGRIAWHWEDLQTVAPLLKKTRKPTVIAAARYLTLAENEAAALLQSAAQADKKTTINLPNPDGTLATYTIWKNEVMAPALAARYPDILSFTGVNTEYPGISAKINYTERGFQAMVLNGASSYFIEPITDQASGYYQCYYKKDINSTATHTCYVAGEAPDWDNININKFAALRKQHGNQLRKYRLALACTHQYAAAVAGSTPTKAAVLSKMVVSINRINGIYERELAVTMQLVGNTDNLIFLTTADDPYTNNSGSLMMGENQTQCDNIIGTANYDIGHVFSTGGGGVAFVGAVCNPLSKARGVTGQPQPVGNAFDVDFVAHEMGHQFGTNHTFNANYGACAGNIFPASAFEPGSGSTIMAYAGFCNGNNLQNNSDDYFHTKSLLDISQYITMDTIGSSCPVVTNSGNDIPVVTSIAAAYAIPYQTPFELTAPPPTDAQHDWITYCWEEYDLGDYGKSFDNTRVAGPIFRSFPPETAPTRVFPTVNKLVKNIDYYLGEKLPDTARKLNFRLTVRDFYNGVGAFDIAEDTVKLTVVNTGTPFRVTLPDTTETNIIGGAFHAVAWDVAGTNQAPINCKTVSVYLSTDSGYHFPITLASNLPNNGSATVFIPNLATTTDARIKVKADSNVFFDITDHVFSLTHNDKLDSTLRTSSVVFPVPASEIVHIWTGVPNTVNITLINTLGQRLWSQNAYASIDLPVSSYSAGTYYLRFIDLVTNEKLVTPIVIAH